MSALFASGFVTAHYPSPKPKLTLTSHLGQNVTLGKGKVGSFSENCNNLFKL